MRIIIYTHKNEQTKKVTVMNISNYKTIEELFNDKKKDLLANGIKHKVFAYNTGTLTITPLIGEQTILTREMFPMRNAYGVYRAENGATVFDHWEGVEVDPSGNAPVLLGVF